MCREVLTSDPSDLPDPQPCSPVHSLLGIRYAFNDMMVYRGLSTLARFLGPRAVVTEVWSNHTVAQWMLHTATFWQNLTRRNPGQQPLPSVHRGPQQQDFSPASAGSASSPCDDLTGVYWGCSTPVPSKEACNGDGAAPIYILSSGVVGGEQSLSVRYPAGNEGHYWTTAHGKATTQGGVTLNLFKPNGLPYGPIPVLRGTTNVAEDCTAFTWQNTNTSWCRNASANFCTHHAPAPPSPPDELADYGMETNLLECVPTYTHKVAGLNAANAWMMRGSGS